MPLIADHQQIRTILETDREWSVYALGDLAPRYAPHCEWHASADDQALILIYRAFELPVLFTLGAPAALAPLLDEVRDPRLHLLVRPEAWPLLAERGPVAHPQAMWRMILNPAAFAPAAPAPGLTPLTVADCPALEALYADGAATGEAPDFFSTAQMETGVYFGIRADAIRAPHSGDSPFSLWAAAGTHLIALEYGVAAVGNVYVRRDQRGRGLGAAVTSAVTAALLAQGLRTIALNVNQRNAPALSVYTRLGYERRGAFYEGLWERALTESD